IKAAKIQPSDDFLLEQPAIDVRRALGALRHEFIEERATEALLETRREIVRLRQILLGQLAQAAPAVDAHKDRRHQGDQCLIGAIGGSGPPRAYVLLARPPRETKGPVAAGISIPPHQPPRPLPEKLSLGGEDSGVGTAVRRRDGK